MKLCLSQEIDDLLSTGEYTIFRSKRQGALVQQYKTVGQILLARRRISDVNDTSPEKRPGYWTLSLGVSLSFERGTRLAYSSTSRAFRETPKHRSRGSYYAMREQGGVKRVDCQRLALDRSSWHLGSPRAELPSTNEATTRLTIVQGTGQPWIPRHV
ncbi:hypothetical protein JAAARDRAFT_266372 [Jaapia argillacea MUCL 33604]|uniref:Uncharacterized protein n=1 Tax=Jaapia argillacea MUCL 33604 TaxID=933084 RepID=A0A067PUG5_9AGAM|nr:hypothetical protein JAAARDRAFT_266372 [Jaapia argillacea MUCL 33604]